MIHYIRLIINYIVGIGFNYSDMNVVVTTVLLRLLRLHVGDTVAGTRRPEIAGQRNHRKIVAVADLNHEAVGVVEEQLIHVNPSFFHPLPQELHFHVFQFPLHCVYTLALEGDVIVFGIDFTFIWQVFWVFGLKQMYSDSIAKQPSPVEIERTGPPNGDKTQNVLIEIY